MPITSTQALERQLADLLARAETTKTKIAEQKRQFSKEQAAIIDCLPKRLGVANLDACLVLIRARMRGQLGPLDAGAPQPEVKRRGAKSKFTEEQRARLDAMCQAKTDDGAKWRHSIAEIAAAIGCATDTVNKRRAFLKKQREAQQPAA